MSLVIHGEALPCADNTVVVETCRWACLADARQQIVGDKSTVTVNYLSGTKADDKGYLAGWGTAGSSKHHPQRW